MPESTALQKVRRNSRLHFKRVNDTYGHAMGDRVIRALANELERNVASCGRIARFGGEEFVAFIPHASIEDAVGIAESIRSGFAARDWRKQGLARSVTVSCGISSIDECETTLDPAVDRADSALYAAKEAGRNSVFFRSPHGVPDTISRDMGKLFAASSRVSK